MADTHKDTPPTSSTHTPPPAGTPHATTATVTPRDTQGIAPFAVYSGALPILVWRVNNATHALPQILRMPEAAALNVNAGTPVYIGAAPNAGMLVERTAITAAGAPIAGFTTEFGHNLTASGTAPVGGSGLYYGSVPNQVNARNVPLGAPMADGRLGINVATDQTEFVGATDAAHVVNNTDLGAIFGLTKDAVTRNWYIDSTISTTAAGACVQITSLVDPIGSLGGRLAFRVLRANQQLFV